MQLKEIINYFEEIAPFSLQESYDNSGIQIGNPATEVKSAILCIDVTENVITEAVKNSCDLIISHHPLLFGGIKKITGQTMTERIIEQAIRNDISIISLHTNIDAVMNGVNARICDKLGLKNRKVLSPVEGKLMKLAFFVPRANAEEVSNAVFKEGAGVIGNYDSCSFNLEGKGSFRAGEGTNPYVGEKGEVHFEEEIRVETIMPSHLKNRVIESLIQAHPYEEVAYDVYPLENKWEQAGMGMTGEMDEEMEEHEFLNALKAVFNAGCVKYTSLLNKKIKKVAVCGGSGSFLLNKAIASKSDVFVSADFKYHQFFEAEGKILIADIGHYESEQFTKELFYENLTKKFPKFAVRLSEVNTNPINYL
ncbi:MAG: Nif3-like dinuclear metal center hexameric protein [Bacteroidales bacterium]